MTEDFEEQPKEPLDIGRYLDLVRRRHMQFLLPLLCGWILVWGASWVLPARYKSSTLILVEQPTMPKNYVVPNISDDLEDRLQSIEQQILSRTRLLLIIDNEHLYSIRHHPMTPDEKVERMRKDIGIELVRDPSSYAINAFKVSYSAPSARIAQRVTSDLTGLFINENQHKLEQESEDTTKFMQKQLNDARASLAQQEAKVRDFQTAHEGELPSQEATNLQILSGLQAQLQNEQDALNTAKQQRIYYQSLLDQYRTLHVSPNPADGGPTGLAAMDQKLEAMRAQLVDLTSRYTDRYPAVQDLKEQIAKTEKMRDQMAADRSAKPGTVPQTGGDNVAVKPVILEQNAALLQLQSQLQANQTEIANREQAVTTLEGRISSYQGRLNAEPESEQGLADLTRGYEQSQANYNDLLKKENESAMATSMEQMQEGERFTVLDPPALPLKPDFPNRLKFCGAGLGIGIAFGVLLAGGLEFLDDRLHRDKDIAMLLPVAVISEIPDVLRVADEKRARLIMIRGWVLAALVFVAILAGSAFSYLHA